MTNPQYIIVEKTTPVIIGVSNFKEGLEIEWENGNTYWRKHNDGHVFFIRGYGETEFDAWMDFVNNL